MQTIEDVTIALLEANASLPDKQAILDRFAAHYEAARERARNLEVVSEEAPSFEAEEVAGLEELAAEADEGGLVAAPEVASTVAAPPGDLADHDLFGGADLFGDDVLSAPEDDAFAALDRAFDDSPDDALDPDPDPGAPVEALGAAGLPDEVAAATDLRDAPAAHEVGDAAGAEEPADESTMMIQAFSDEPAPEMGDAAGAEEPADESTMMIQAFDEEPADDATAMIAAFADDEADAAPGELEGAQGDDRLPEPDGESTVMIAALADDEATAADADPVEPEAIPAGSVAAAKKDGAGEDPEEDAPKTKRSRRSRRRSKKKD